MQGTTLGRSGWGKRHRYGRLLNVSALLQVQQYRVFSTIQKGHDRQKESLFNKLGFTKDEEAQCIRRPFRDLEAGFLQQAKQLRDPVHDPKDRARLEELKKAYLLLRDDNFRRNYASHHYSSNDVRLHVLQDGDHVAANFNPEHYAFESLNHSPRGTIKGAATATAAVRGGDVDDDDDIVLDSAAPTASFGDFRAAFRNATGVTAQAGAVRPPPAAARGAHIAFCLQLTFQEGLWGCAKVLVYERDRRCGPCGGSGVQGSPRGRPCPACLGRGHVQLPSATYAFAKRCPYCAGEGLAAAPRCGHCEGRGVQGGCPAQLPLRVPAGTTAARTTMVLPGKGHDGSGGGEQEGEDEGKGATAREEKGKARRKGRAGDMILTILVAPPRGFYRHGKALHAMLPLPLSVAMLGGGVKVRTPLERKEGATASLRIPPGVRHGQVLVLPRAMEGGESKSPLLQEEVFYHVLVCIPDGGRLTGRQKEALRDYEDATQASLGESAKAGIDQEAVEQNSNNREERIQQCAALKVKYSHWFRA